MPLASVADSGAGRIRSRTICSMGLTMAYDEELAERARSMVPAGLPVDEIKMFGGLAFMINGHMAFGVMKDSLMLRLEPDEVTEALGEPHVRLMDFTGRPMRNMLLVGPDGLEDDALRGWVVRAASHASARPPKQPKVPRRPKAANARRS